MPLYSHWPCLRPPPPPPPRRCSRQSPRAALTTHRRWRHAASCRNGTLTTCAPCSSGAPARQTAAAVLALARLCTELLLWLLVPLMSTATMRALSKPRYVQVRWPADGCCQGYTRPRERMIVQGRWSGLTVTILFASTLCATSSASMMQGVGTSRANGQNLPAVGSQEMCMLQHRVWLQHAVQLSETAACSPPVCFPATHGICCAGFYPRILRVEAPAKYQAVAGGAMKVEADPASIKFFERTLGRVWVHPASVCFSAGSYPSGTECCGTAGSLLRSLPCTSLSTAASQQAYLLSVLWFATTVGGSGTTLHVFAKGAAGSR